jgi:hypothetical protein
MRVLVRPRRAVVDVLDVLGEVLAAASIATADAVAWARSPGPQPRLQLVPALNPDPTGRVRSTEADRG